MPKISSQLIQEISKLGSPAVLLIAIDSCGGAGKSTYAAELAAKLSNCQTVHIDDFYKPKKQRVEVTEDVSVHINFEFDRLKQHVLQPIKLGQKVAYQTSLGKAVTIEATGHVIVEGLGTLGLELNEYFDYKIWIESPESVRRSRGIARDSKEWTKIWDEEYLPQDARYVREQLPHKRADWIIENN